MVVVNYGMHRVRPAWAELAELEAQADALAAQRAELEPQASPGQTAALARRVDSLRNGLAARREQVAALDRGWAREDQAADLAWQVAALAQETRLRIESEERSPTLPVPVEAAAEAPLGAVLQRAPFERPTHSYTISGRFGDLWRFLDRLDDLPWEALVVDMQVERPTHLEHRDLPLRITLVMAL